MSGEKTISLDLSLFTDKGKNGGSKANKGSKTNKTIRKGRKLKPKVNGQNVKSLRKNLLAKIKEHQKRENHENLSSKKRNSYDNSDSDSNNNNNNNNNNKQNVKVINAQELFDDEFTKSLSYLSALSKSREDKKQERKKKKNILRLQPKPQLQPNHQLQPKPQLEPNHLKIAKPIGNNVNNVKHKTIKQTTRNANIPDISLDLPPELDEPKIDIDIIPTAVTSKVNKGSSILGFKPNITLLNEKSDNQSSNNDHKEPIQPNQTKQPNVFMNLPKINNDPPFGVLKNGNKPTFRQFNKTQKNLQKNPIKIENSSNKPNIRMEPTTTSTRQNVLNNLREKRQINSNANSQLNNGLNRSKPMVIPENKSKNKKTIRRTITTRKFKLGKNGKKRIISVLVKNNSTRRNIKQEVGQLKRTPIKEIKAYLRKHGMLKVGSSAPNDVLRHIYENSVLSGDIRNMSKDTLIHNFFNDKEEF